MAILHRPNRTAQTSGDSPLLEAGNGDGEEAEADKNELKLLEKIEERHRIDEKNLEILNVIEGRKLFRLLKGRLKLVGNSLEHKNGYVDVMIKKATNPKNQMQRMLINLELVHLCDSPKHPNLLELKGFIEENGHYSIVTEYPEGGNLLDYVRRIKKNGKFKNQLSNSGYSKTEMKQDTQLGKLCTLDLLSITWQILNGMIEMAKHPFYHRQLSLSNIFIIANKTVKIGNFSLARTNGHNEYYKKNTNWEMLTSHRAPETYTDGRFTRQSDVWSFGVLLFELFSLGEVPYQGQEDILKFVKSGKHLDKPKYCHPELYQLMAECWNLEQFKRPTFEKIQEELKEHLEKYNIKVITRR
ncbi:hypothetical protein CAEBREN_19981 [Caenorhabditis brenneri]|uniref:Protein kinase domain-containing protein n=1 Tax=Caenorhabditis brenneri TaxID=135651 RepID=G0NN37_CAEBE|nr:hypothetical protein CAEBREN_19981 [Caenorhabditis brenneri]